MTTLEPDTQNPDLLEVDADGWSGRITVDPTETLQWDGADLPAVTWHMPLYSAERLIQALTALDEIIDAVDAHHESSPGGWADESATLAKALERLVEQGRAYWHRNHDDTLSITAGAPRRCRVCGCTDDKACVAKGRSRCHWIADDLCSACPS